MFQRYKLIAAITAILAMAFTGTVALAQTTPAKAETELSIKSANDCAATLAFSEGFASLPRLAVVQKYAEFMHITPTKAKDINLAETRKIMLKAMAKETPAEKIAEVADKCSADYGLNLAPALPRVKANFADGLTGMRQLFQLEYWRMHAIPAEQYDRHVLATIPEGTGKFVNKNINKKMQSVVRIIQEENASICYKAYLMWGNQADINKIRRIYGRDVKSYGNINSMVEQDREKLRKEDSFFEVVPHSRI